MNRFNKKLDHRLYRVVFYYVHIIIEEVVSGCFTRFRSFLFMSCRFSLCDLCLFVWLFSVCLMCPFYVFYHVVMCYTRCFSPLSDSVWCFYIDGFRADRYVGLGYFFVIYDTVCSFFFGLCVLFDWLYFLRVYCF